MENEQVQINHVCGVCEESFPTEEEYLAHVCQQTGFTPTEPEHLINSTTPNFAEISKAALDRGSSTDEQPETPAEPTE